MTTTTAAKPDLYTHILRLVDQLQPEDRLQLVAYIVQTVQPLVARPAAAAEDDEDDEDLAQAGGREGETPLAFIPKTTPS